MAKDNGGNRILEHFAVSPNLAEAHFIGPKKTSVMYRKNEKVQVGQWSILEEIVSN